MSKVPFKNFPIKNFPIKKLRMSNFSFSVYLTNHLVQTFLNALIYVTKKCLELNWFHFISFLVLNWAIQFFHASTIKKLLILTPSDSCRRHMYVTNLWEITLIDFIILNRSWNDAQVIACACAITHTNQEKGGLCGLWKACPNIKLHGLISPTQNSQ